MKGNPKVIDAFNEVLHEELMAIDQYCLHAEMCENWHCDRLGELIKKQSIGENEQFSRSVVGALPRRLNRTVIRLA